MATKMDIQKIMTRGSYEGFTAYMIASLINAKLSEAGLEAIRPQMMYNYDKNGLINGTKKQSAERYYTTEEAVTFVEKFVTKRIAKGQDKPIATSTPSAFTVEDVEAAKQYIDETEPTLEFEDITA